MFVAIARKSHRNLECCIEAELTDKVLNRLTDCDDVVASLLIELLAVLTQYRCVAYLARWLLGKENFQCECARDETTA